MTSETSDQRSDDERQLDVNFGTIKRLLIYGYDHYQKAVDAGHHIVSTYWDGYIRALQHVLEAEQE